MGQYRNTDSDTLQENAAGAKTCRDTWLYASKSMPVIYKQHIKQTQTGTILNWSNKGTFFYTRFVLKTTFS